MPEPENSESSGTLPLDWSVSNLTASTPPKPNPPVPPRPPAPDAVQLEAAKSVPVAAPPVAPPAAEPSPAPIVAAREIPNVGPQPVNPDLLGAIGAWQVRRAPEPHPPLIERAVAAAAAPLAKPAVAPIPPAPAFVPAPTSVIAPVSAPVSMPAPASAQVAVATPASAPPVAPSPMIVPFVPDAEEAAEPKPPCQPILTRLGFWRITTAIAALIAVGLGVAVLNRPAGFDSGVAAIGVVNAPAPIFLAEFGSGHLRLTPLAIVQVPPAKDLQLWMFMPESQTPISLGVLPAAGGVFTLPQVPPEGSRFIISLEPHGGSTAGKVEGQVLYGGTLATR